VKEFRTARDSASITSVVSKRLPPNFIFNQKQESCWGTSQTSRVGGDDSNIILSQKFPSEKGSVRWCVIMIQQPVLLSSKFGAKADFIGCHSNMRNWLFGLSGQILCEQSPSCQRKLWACAWLCSSPSSSFSVPLSLYFHVRLMLSSPNACLIISRVCVAPFPRFAQNLMYAHYSFVQWIAKSHLTRYTTLNKRT
jgi:hypothetical protein